MICPAMARPLDDYVSRTERWIHGNRSVLDGWILIRCVEDPDLDAAKLTRSMLGYLPWCAQLACAASSNLEKRRWNSVKTFFDNEIALSFVSIAESTPTDRGVPALLQGSFIIHLFLYGIDNPQAHLVVADWSREVSIGALLLGESRAQELSTQVQQIVRRAIVMSVNDVMAAPDSLKVAPEHLIPLRTVISGGREISSGEQSLVGRWVWQDFYSSGGFSARTELHMLLMPDGHCVRTPQSIASAAFKDSNGQWIGTMEAAANIPAKERGNWRAGQSMLTLEMDDGSAYEYRYTLEGAKLLTRTPGGKQRFWTRDRL